MSNIDKQALRADAMEATGGSWVRESGEGWEAICCDDDQGDTGFIIAEFQGENATANRKFVQSANPATVLALLDELDKWQQESSAWQAVAEKQLALAEDAENRIAELEAREVVPDEMTPKQASRSYCGEVRGYRDGWNACRAAMLQCADDSIAHEGKNRPEDKLGMVDHFGGSNNMVEPVTDNTNQQFESLSRGDK